MRLQHLLNLMIGAAATSLSACGGGGVASIPFVPAPTPPPPDTGSSVLPPEHLGLVSADPFAVLAVGGETSSATRSAQDVQFSYDASDNSYDISLPGFQSGTLAGTDYNGSVGDVATSSFSKVTAGSSTTLQDVSVFLPVPGSSGPYTYTSWGTWVGHSGQADETQGIFAYGIPTAAGDIPVSGSATYAAEILATSSAYDLYVPEIGGDASLVFDFAHGTLSGYMHPQINDGWNGIFVDFGRYDFTQTVYSSGSTTFSGKFIVPGMPGADSFFDGTFTGPGAAELMARFAAPYSQEGTTGTISGVWIGKKGAH